MKLLSLRNRHQGDTIVEVMIAIVVIGSVLVAAYTTSNKSLLYMEGSQERTDALTIAQAQVEQLRIATTFTDDGGCFDSSHNPTANPANCKFGTSSRYQVAIYVNTPTANTYEVQVVWANVAGPNNENITIYYRTPPL